MIGIILPCICEYLTISDVDQCEENTLNGHMTKLQVNVVLGLVATSTHSEAVICSVKQCVTTVLRRQQHQQLQPILVLQCSIIAIYFLTSGMLGTTVTKILQLCNGKNE